MEHGTEPSSEEIELVKSPEERESERAVAVENSVDEVADSADYEDYGVDMSGEDLGGELESQVEDEQDRLESLHLQDQFDGTGDFSMDGKLTVETEDGDVDMQDEYEDEEELQQACKLPSPQKDRVPYSSSCSSDDSDTLHSNSKHDISSFSLILRQHEEGRMYTPVSKLGEGTFSTVYKAIDRTTCGLSAAARGETSKKSFVALKRIYVTSSPQRIRGELEILADLREGENISKIISAFRHRDQIVIVMPYIPHDDFKSFYRTCSLNFIRSYMRSLLSGLSYIHTMGIIHRDIKPANFLLDSADPNSGKVCDFGLAERMDPDSWRGACLHSVVVPRLVRNSGGRFTSGCVYDGGWGERWGPDRSLLHGLELARPMSTRDQLKGWEERQFQDYEVECNGGDGSDVDWKPWYLPWEDCSALKEEMKMKKWSDTWRPVKTDRETGREREKVGYSTEDKRPGVKANRAGTRGFRAPEVLLKCPDQTTAVDCWSAGIILLSFLTRRFPFFQSNDDTEALIEISTLFGKARMQRCAAMHNRRFLTNCPGIETPPATNLHELIFQLNPSIFFENSPLDITSAKGGRSPFSKREQIRRLTDLGWYKGSELWEAIELCRKLLAVDLTRRWTAGEGLRSGFLRSEEV